MILFCYLNFAEHGNMSSVAAMALFSSHLFSNHYKRHVEAEQNAAAWPPWLTLAAAETVQGWSPLKANSFQKLDQVQLHLTIQVFIFYFF